MPDKKRSSLPARILFRAILTMILIWALAIFLPQFVELRGGVQSVIIVGALVTLLNLLVRPFLVLITFPFKLFAMILAIILVNGIFLWLLQVITANMDPTVLKFAIHGGFVGWIIVALLLGLGNWIMKEMLK